MTTPSDDLMDRVRRELASWQATHPDATFAEIETAVEDQIERVRAALLQEHLESLHVEERPRCPECGTTMVPRSRSARTVILAGDEPVRLDRTYVVCPACGTGLFPPG